MATHCRCASIAALLLAALAACATSVHALSWPLCEDGGQVWVTERPHTEPTFPGANLWFFCETGLNIMGESVSDCVLNGTVCTQQIPDALCRAIGFDRAVVSDVKYAAARPDEPVRALSGEYCLRRGNYSATLPEDLGSLPGEPCRKVQGLTCIRSRQSMVAIINQTLLAAPSPNATSAESAAGDKPAPAEQAVAAPADGSAPAVTAQSKPEPAATSEGGGARKLRF